MSLGKGGDTIKRQQGYAEQARSKLNVKHREESRAARIRDYGRERVVGSSAVRDQRIIETMPNFDREMALGTIALFHSRLATNIQKISLFSRLSHAFIRYGILVIALLLIVGGIALTVLSLQDNTKVQKQIDVYATEAADSGETPSQSSTKSGANTNASTTGFKADEEVSTNPRYPKHLRISSIGVSALTTKVGINSKGNIGTPANIHNTSWYEGSSSPVDAIGSAVFVGHVGTAQYAGVFASLYKTQVGAEIVVTMGDDKTFTYTVKNIEDIPADKLDMAPYLSYLNGKTRVMHLITCTGDYNARTNTYSHRLIVTAEQK